MELEALEGLTVEQEVELAGLRPKAEQWQKRKEGFAERYRARKVAAARVVELEALKGARIITGRGRLLPIVLWSWRR
ncbi:hypothetical protein [Saccharopolyspora spinosa]|uniref:hypothetical protein n=1 Tax=Saccharopolyspora spinosa TaxID=60894 RepID=UPI000237AB78|nr:hypothetical protein [Saccharopolyspora spinosa]